MSPTQQVWRPSSSAASIMCVATMEVSTTPKSQTARMARRLRHVVGEDEHHGRPKPAARAGVHLLQPLSATHHVDALRLLVLSRGRQAADLEHAPEFFIFNGRVRKATLGETAGCQFEKVPDPVPFDVDFA